MKTWLIISGVVGLLVVAGIIVVIGKQRGVELGQYGSSTSTSDATEVVFTEPIVDPATIKNITPLGELNGGYNEVQTLAGVMVNFKEEAVAGNKEVEVRAPVDMTLERYSLHTVDFAPGSQWVLVFRLSKNVTMRMDHISRASDAIVAATTSTPKSNSGDEALKKPLKVKAGEVIAYTFGTVPAHNWNIYVYDDRTTTTFANQQRYEQNEVGQRLIQATCPFDFYGGALKESYYALLGYSKAGQSETCGAVSHDVVGTASGLWHFSPTQSNFNGEQDGAYQGPLSIIKNSAGEVTIYQVDGQRLDVAADDPTNKDPAEITGEHCYQAVNVVRPTQKAGYAFIKIISDTEMELAASKTGTCPTEFPTSVTKMYYR